MLDMTEKSTDISEIVGWAATVTTAATTRDAIHLVHA